MSSRESSLCENIEANRLFADPSHWPPSQIPAPHGFATDYTR